ncbi:MAG: hypothetical protein PWR01_4606 [Clostridiales bacterium]|nr:hypothetical protein [Clostridiales bacterium]MDN5283533.1 hypothetical protein [Candidatus Ozemobacter sp.]
MIAFIFIFGFAASVYAVSPEFAEIHRETLVPDKNLVFKKTLFVCGLINAAYLGLNDQVAALQLVKKNQPNAEELAAQLLAVKIGLIEKPALLRYIAKEIKFCEKYPNFPLGFNDSPEGPEKISAEFYKIADHIEKLPVNHQSKDIRVLRKEAQRVVFDLFWTDSEKMRTLCMDMLNFIRKELKEDLPFDIFAKPIKPILK